MKAVRIKMLVLQPLGVEEEAWYTLRSKEAKRNELYTKERKGEMEKRSVNRGKRRRDVSHLHTTSPSPSLH